MMSKNVKFKYKDTKQKSFDKVKLVMSRNNLLDYLDFNKKFDINNNAINLELGSVINMGEKKNIL